MNLQFIIFQTTFPFLQQQSIKYLVCISLAFFSYADTYAQKEANVWHFGFGYSLDFNSGSAVQTSGSAMVTSTGSTSICDSLGNLLFYTNGGGRVPGSNGVDQGHIWNKNNGVMYDMQGLEGGGSNSKQTSVIIPAPGEPNVYYLFTVEETGHYIDATPAILAAQPNGRGFRYFKIDMSLNGGLGAVTQANVPLYDFSCEGLCAIRHANEKDYWILVNQDTTGIGVYKVTSAGITLSNISPNNASYNSFIKASPHSITAQKCNVYFEGGVLDFDLTTGVLSNLQSVGFAVSSVEFSPNGNYLYTCQLLPIGLGLYRYDMLASNTTGQSLESTRVLISPLTFAFFMQLAPDGKIYFIRDQSSQGLGPFSLCTIDCPNSLTPSVTFDVFNYSVGVLSDSAFISLPNFPAWIFYNNNEDYLEFGPDTVFICPGDSIILDAGLGTSRSWGGDCFSGPQSTWPTSSTRFFTVTQPGTYSATATGLCSLQAISDQITVFFTSPPSLSATSVPGNCGLPNATATVAVTGGSGSYSYSWSNGATGNVVTGLAAGNYTVVATDQDGCTTSTQVAVSSTPASGVSLIANDTLLESGDSVNLQVLGANSYVWSPASGLSCSNCPSVNASPLQSTTYQVTGNDSSGCSYLLKVRLDVEIKLNEIFVPDAFSPNNDGNNDKLYVRGSIKDFTFSVFNRWGEVVFRTQNQSSGWDGLFRGQELGAGVFVYYLSGVDAAGNTINKKGNITLVK
jgi:gliding motility-associated-like protein